MTRILAWTLPVCLGIGVAIWTIPAWGDEAKPLPYTCLPLEVADEVHVKRGDVLLGSRQQGRFVEFLWLTPEGDFLHVSFDRATFRVCAIRRTPHDPRKDRSS